MPQSCRACEHPEREAIDAVLLGGGRVHKEYVGAGEVAEAVAHADETIRRARELERARCRAEAERLEALTAPVEDLSEAASILARAHLIAGGYHRHKGEWRRARNA